MESGTKGNSILWHHPENLSIGAKYYSQYDGGVSLDSLKTYMKENVIGIELQRSDWQYMYNCFISDVNIGVKFTKQTTGVGGAVDSSNAQIFGLSVTNSLYGLYFEHNNMASQVSNLVLDTDKDCIVLKKDFTGSVAINGSTLTSKEGNCVVADSGCSGAISLMDSTFEGWKEGAYAVNALGGGILLDNCKAAVSGTAVMLSSGVTGASINNCSGMTVNNKIGDNAAIGCGTYMEADCLSNVPDLKGRVPNVSGNTFINIADRDANNDGNTDVTSVFQKALDDAAKNGGVVYVPAGKYLLNGTLNIPSGVELRGVSMTGHHSNAMGTVLLTTQGQGNEHGTPFITLDVDSGIRGLTIWYPVQDIITPIQYPYSISAEAQNVWVIDTTVGNGWNGLYLGKNSGAHYISYFQGFNFLHDIYLDGSDSRGYILNCHFNLHFYIRTTNTLPGGKPDSSIAPIVGTIGTTKTGSVVLGDAKDEILFNTFTYRARVGLKFIGNGFSGLLLGCGFDGARTGVEVESTGSQVLMINFLSDVVPSNPLFMDMRGGDIVMINSGFTAFNHVPASGIVVSGGKLEMRQLCFGVSSVEAALAVAGDADVTLCGALFMHRGVINDANSGFVIQAPDSGIDILSTGNNFTLTSALGKEFKSVTGILDQTYFKVY